MAFFRRWNKALSVVALPCTSKLAAENHWIVLPDSLSINHSLLGGWWTDGNEYLCAALVLQCFFVSGVGIVDWWTSSLGIAGIGWGCLSVGMEA